MRNLVRNVFLSGLFFAIASGRIHTLQLLNDDRSVIVMTSFGYLEGSSLEVNITNLKIHPTRDAKIGFSLDKSSSSGSSSYVEREESTRGCVLDIESANTDLFKDVPRALFKLVKKDNRYVLEVYERDLYGMVFYSTKSQYKSSEVPVTTPSVQTTESQASTTASATTTTSTTTTTISTATTAAAVQATDKSISPERKDLNNTDSRKKREAVTALEGSKGESDGTNDAKKFAGKFVHTKTLPTTGDLIVGLNLSFYVRVEKEEQNGLYELYFHDCDNIMPSNEYDQDSLVRVDLTAHIVEMNGDSYLSAGDMALPMMYGVISAVFFGVSFLWLNVICHTKDKVFKIHYLMAVMILIKALSVMFHSLDYYFIARDGQTEAWAVIYYIVHLLKGVLLIICLLLIGSGWAFIKYILSDRDKKLFMIVIPMQVIANVAYIIMEETEEGNKSYYTWKDIVILVDILCCGAILIPVVWSIRHLQEASQTDGKAAVSLAKLELFRHFYIMVVCYLYFTRIIVYLLEITLPFHYIWIHALFSELGAFLFFFVTGYKFRPGCDNPYFQLPQYDEEEELEEAITQSGATETISKVNRYEKDVADADEFDVLLPKQKTSKV